MISFENVTGENTQKQNPCWPQIPNHPSKIIITGKSGSGRTKALLNLINHKQEINKAFLYAKDTYEPKYQYLIKKREEVSVKHREDSKAFYPILY